MIEDELFERGLAVRREVWGVAGADAQIDGASHLTEKMQELVTRWCFGDIWSRDGLARRTRSMITVSMLLALGRNHELGIHMRGALANGVTDEELREICLHAVPYCGIPAANEGLRTLAAVLADERPDSSLLEPAARAGDQGGS
jgi:4-carboxymuconolactone decarboxylase